MSNFLNRTTYRFRIFVLLAAATLASNLICPNALFAKGGHHGGGHSKHAAHHSNHARPSHAKHTANSNGGGSDNNSNYRTGTNTNTNNGNTNYTTNHSGHWGPWFTNARGIRCRNWQHN